MEEAFVNCSEAEELGTILFRLERFCKRHQMEELGEAAAGLGERLTRREVRLAVLGQMKRGKSSIINALLGLEVLPTGIVPLTSVITEIRGGSKASAWVEYKSGLKNEIPMEEIAHFVTEKANPGNRKRVLKLSLTVPSDLLVHGLILIDTPGIGSTHAQNSVTTVDYLKELDSALVVFSPDPPITEAEASFLSIIRSEITKLYFVLNKSDQVSPQELNEARAFLRGELLNRFDIPVDHIFTVSARNSLPAKTIEDEQNLGKLREEIRRFALEQGERALVHSVAADAHLLVQKAAFIAAVSERASSLTVPELAALHSSVPISIENARREQAALRTLIRQDEADLLSEVTNALEDRVKRLMPGVLHRLRLLTEYHADASGTTLGMLLETFLVEEIRSAFLKWRVQKDEQLSAKIAGTVGRFAATAEDIIRSLADKAGGLLRADMDRRTSIHTLAMDSRVTYKITPVFYSLDRALLLLPSALQRRVVLKRFEETIRSELDRNAGKIRFDYLERFERTFAEIERSLMREIDETVGILVEAISPSPSIETSSGEFQRLADRLSALASIEKNAASGAHL